MNRGRSITLTTAVVVAVLLAFLGSMRWDLTADAVRPRLEAAIARDTGYRIVSLGSVAFTALPWPLLQVANLELANGANATEMASVPLAKARLNLFSWLAGDPRITALTLFDPKLSLRAADRPEETEAVAALIGNYLRRGHRPSLSYLRVSRGQATLDGGAWLSDLSFVATNVASSDLRLIATGIYHALPFRLQVEVAPAARASVRPLQWEFDLGDLAATFRGVLVAAPSLDAEGQFSIALGAGALRSRPFALSRETAGLLDGLTIEGEGRMSLPQVQFRTVQIERGDLRLSGAVDMTLSAAAPRLAATLHAQSIDLGTSDAEAVWSTTLQSLREPSASRSVLRGLNADLRLSTQRVNVAGLRMQDVAAAVKLGPGRIEASLSEGKLGGGVAKARLAFSDNNGRLEGRITAQMQQVDMLTALGPSATPFAAGIATGQISIDTSGSTNEELLAGASGRGRIAIANGTLRGLDLDRHLRQPEVTSAAGEGRTAFNQLDAMWIMANGVATVSEASIRGALWTSRFEGDIDLRTRIFDFAARLSPSGPTGSREERAISIKGPILAPQIRAVQTNPGRS